MSGRPWALLSRLQKAASQAHRPAVAVSPLTPSQLPEPVRSRATALHCSTVSNLLSLLTMMTSYAFQQSGLMPAHEAGLQVSACAAAAARPRLITARIAARDN